MERLEQAATMLSLIEKLKASGSWGGETHIQKATYLLQEVLGVDMGFEFILYKHGPYSFELSDELKSMRADGFLALAQTPPYGATLKKGEMGEVLLEDYGKIVSKQEGTINFIANHLGNMGVLKLEKLTTAVFIKKEKSEADDVVLAECINEEKPHISIEEASQAIKEAEKLMVEAKKI